MNVYCVEVTRFSKRDLESILSKRFKHDLIDDRFLTGEQVFRCGVRSWLHLMGRHCVLDVTMNDKADHVDLPGLVRRIKPFLMTSCRIDLAGVWNAVLDIDIDCILTTEM